MAAQKIPLYTPEQYLVLERAASHRSEYFNGEIYAMAGASLNHNRITVNALLSLGPQLRARGCETFTGDMKVKTEQTSSFTYPDLTIVCGPPRFDDDQKDVLLNPLVIVEVLSPSTESHDRGAKFAHYQRLESLAEYVLISQDKARVEVFRRNGTPNEWGYVAYEGLDAVALLASLDGLVLPLTELYANVEFPPDTNVPLPGFHTDNQDRHTEAA